MKIKETEDGILIGKDFYDKLIERLDKVNEIINRLDKVESLIQEQNFAEMGFAEEFFEYKVDAMVETLLSIYIFGNKKHCFNHWCDKISSALTETMQKMLPTKEGLAKVSDVLKYMDESSSFIQYCLSDFSVKEMLKKIEKNEGKFLKQREIEQYQKFLFSSFTAIKIKAVQNPIDRFNSLNIRKALAIYADLDDLYFKENPDVERPNCELHQQEYFKVCGKYDESI